MLRARGWWRCASGTDVRVIAATTERDPELGSAIVTAGASGLLARRAGDRSEMEDALRRAVAGELVLPDDHLSSLVDSAACPARAGHNGAADLDSLTARELEVLATAVRWAEHRRGIDRAARHQPDDRSEPRQERPGETRRALEGGGRPASPGASGRSRCLRAPEASGHRDRRVASEHVTIAPTRVLVVGGHPVILGVGPARVRRASERPDRGRGGRCPAAVAAATSLDAGARRDRPRSSGTDGVDVLRSLRDQGFRGLVVVVSERADGATVLGAMRLGVDAYLIKPDGLRRSGTRSAASSTASG